MKNKELFEALSLLEKERGIPVDFMLDKIKKANDIYILFILNFRQRNFFSRRKMY